MVGMRAGFSQFQHGGTHGFGLRFTILQTRVKVDHEVLGTLIVDVPETQHERVTASLKQAANQAHEFIARAHNVQACGAAA